MTQRRSAVGVAVACAILGAVQIAAAQEPVREPPPEATEPMGPPDEAAPIEPPPEAAPPSAVSPIPRVDDPHDIPPSPAPKAEDEGDDAGIDYLTPRYEPAGIPLIGGNSDIGVQFGAVGRLTRFGYNARPFLFRLDLLLTASVRDSGGGPGLAQQEYLSQLDLPNIFGSRIRTTFAVQFLNFVDAGYYGRGNASSPLRPAVVDGNAERFFQHTAREFRIRDFTRIRIKKPFDLMIAPIVRYHDHAAYPGSKLAVDARDGLIRGLRPVLITSLGVGLVVDTRDNEFFPHKGMLHQIGSRFEQGYPIGGDVQAGASGAIFAGYLPLGGPFVAAGRVVVDFLYGKVPYYDLYNAGPFNDWEMPGGANGIRGVPWGRYSAPIKTIANLELRALYFKFGLLGQRFRLGNDIFFDAGRVFDAYSFDAPRDGKGVGLKWGAGGGLDLMWGEGALFRAEIAYSPDAVDANPRFPIGLYLADGVMF